MFNREIVNRYLNLCADRTMNGLCEACPLRQFYPNCSDFVQKNPIKAKGIMDGTWKERKGPCNHLIGCLMKPLKDVIHDGSLSLFCTVDDVKREIVARREHNVKYPEPTLVNYGWDSGWVYPVQEYSWEEYMNLKKDFPLLKFKFCPECGAKIDWKKLREGEKPEGF